MIRRLLPVFLLAITAAAQQTPAAPPNPCAAPEQKQFDFWVGEWDASWPGQKQGEVLKGTNSIKRVLDSCIVEENFSGGPLKGHSVSVYVPRAGKWKQTWVDNQGSYLDFVGEFKDGQMTLWREATKPDGTKIMQRMVFKNIKSDSFDWSWEASQDGGKTWQVQWPIHYQRRS
jgi:hypothetical protein